MEQWKLSEFGSTSTSAHSEHSNCDTKWGCKSRKLSEKETIRAVDKVSYRESDESSDDSPDEDEDETQDDEYLDTNFRRKTGFQNKNR